MNENQRLQRPDLPDLLRDFSISARPFLVSKTQPMPVRWSRPGELMQTGEVAPRRSIAILDPDNISGQPLYFMEKDEFVRTSEPCLNRGNRTDAEVTFWNVEKNIKMAYLIDESHGAFHLEAPKAWGNQSHGGWDVEHVSELQDENGNVYRGYMLVETSHRLIYDKYATEAGLYKLAHSPA